MDDPVLLAIVIDDPLAPRVLAACKALGLQLDEVDDHKISQIAMLASGSYDDTRKTYERCKLARLIIDGGISALADQWLSAHVSTRLASKPTAKKKKP